MERRLSTHQQYTALNTRQTVISREIRALVRVGTPEALAKAKSRRDEYLALEAEVGRVITSAGVSA